MSLITDILTIKISVFANGNWLPIWIFLLLAFISTLPLMVYIFLIDKESKGEWLGFTGYYIFKFFGRKNNGN